MDNAGYDESILVKKLDKKEVAEKVEEITDPIIEKLSKLEDENLIAFRLSKEGYDTVYNIGHHWTYNMVQECQIYIDFFNEYQEREVKKLERNT